MTILETMKIRKGMLSEDDLLTDKAEEFISNELFALILCLGGTGTSTFVAQQCLKNNVPTAYYYGGLYHLDDIACQRNNKIDIVSHLIQLIPITVLLVTKPIAKEFVPNIYKYLRDVQHVNYIADKQEAKNTVINEYYNR
jgi:hypothetical protein